MRSSLVLRGWGHVTQALDRSSFLETIVSLGVIHGKWQKLEAKEISWFMTLRTLALAQLDPEAKAYSGSLFSLCVSLPQLPTHTAVRAWPHPAWSSFHGVCPGTSSRHPWMALIVFMPGVRVRKKEMVSASISQVLGSLLLTSLWAVSLPEPLTEITNQGWLGSVPFPVAEGDGPYRWGCCKNERRAAQGRGVDAEQVK